MKRGDAAVLTISAVLATSVVAAVVFSVLVQDRKPDGSAAVSGSSVSSVLALTWVVGIWLIVLGIFEIISSFMVKKAAA